MRKVVILFIAGGMLAPALLRAADDGERDMARDLGAVLAWRLGPEVVEEQCRTLDPDGAEVRKKALTSWLERNARLIEAVDSRVAEVVPLMRGPAAMADPVKAVRSQVATMLVEGTFGGKAAEESKAICAAEANPASPRWNNPGLPLVPGSLAALHDWKISRTAH